jgi:hypothetical protein
MRWKQFASNEFRDSFGLVTKNAVVFNDFQWGTFHLDDNPDITQTFKFCRVGGHSPGNTDSWVLLFGLVNERIGGDLASTEITLILPACRQRARCTRRRVFVEQRPAGAPCRWCS